MALKVSQVDVWVADIVDRPGGLGCKLAQLAQAGANLEFIIARRKPERPGKGVVFVTPLKAGRQVKAAKKAGFKKSASLRSVRLLSADKKGLGARITLVLAQAGINLRGLSASAMDKKAVTFLAFDSARDAAKAVKVLKKLA